MAISKIILNGVTQMDLTGDTVQADKLLQSYTAHGADGEPITGTSTAIVPSGSQTVTENGTFDVSSLAEMVVNVASGGGSIQTKTGTFVGGDGRTQTLSCSFEPDIIYIHGTTTEASVRATETFLIVRDLIQWVKYYSSTSNTSSFGYGIRHNITGLDPNANTSYTYQTSYSNGTITMYAYSNQDRYFFKSDITYSYKFIKYT